MARSSVADARGFSLIETLIALGVLTAGLLATAQVMAFSLAMSADSGDDMLARQKAAEAVESVFTARDTATVSWAQVRNVLGETGADNGVFLDGLRPLTKEGPDGLLNTADDAGAGIQSIKLPGPDGQLGTADDTDRFLNSFQRQIEITSVAGNPNLRRLKVTITYRSEQRARTFVIDTLISAFS